MRVKTVLASIAAIAAVASIAGAQQRPPIRKLGAVVAKSAEPLGSVAGLRQLPDGRLFVNDLAKRRVLLFDPSLATFTVVADSTSATANAYSGRVGGLIAYRGDSTLFVDPTSLSMLVLDATGKVVRVMSVPRSQDAMMFANFGVGGAAFDASGRLVYRAPPSFRRPNFQPGGGFQMPELPDSAAIVRIDLTSRKVDTLGFIKTPKVKIDVSRDDNGRVTARTQINPLPVVDDWAVLSDGSVAFVRGRDYHVEILNPDGTKTSAAKLPFDWQRLTDDDKAAFIDSVKAARARLGANAPNVALGAAAGAIFGGGGDAPQMVFIGGPGGGGPPPAGGREGGGGRDGGGRDGGGRDGGGGAGPNIRVGGGNGGGVELNYVAPSELPDYKPPFFAGQMRADTDGNLWIRTIPTKAIPGGPVYDVVNRRGELVDRVQIPEGRTIVGFGSGGSVYLGSRDNATVILERAKLR